MTSRKPNKVPSIKDREKPRLATKRGLSVRLLLATAIVLALLAGASYAWRNYQVKRLAPDLLKQAEALEAQGKLAESTQRIFQYLQINPDDAEAKITLAEKYDAAAQDISRKLRAIELYSQALPTAPASKQAELHRRRGTLLLEVATLQLQAIDPEVQQQKAEVTARLAAAGDEAAAVLSVNERDPEACRILAWSLLGRHELKSLSALPAGVTSIGAAFERAVELNPADCELVVRLARIYRSQPDVLDENKKQLPEAERAKLADAMVDRVVGAQAKVPEALLARFAYRRAYNVPGADDDLAGALTLAPENVAVRLACGMAAQTRAGERMAAGSLLAAQDERNTAREHYVHAAKLAPTDVRPYLLLGQLHREQGEIDQAVKALNDGLQVDKGNLQLNALVADCLLTRQDQDEQRWQQVATHLEAYNSAVDRVRQYVGADTWRTLQTAGALLKARLLIQQKKFAEAVPLLKFDDPVALPLRDRMVASQLLELCYRSQQQWEDAARKANELTEFEPTAVEPRLLAALDWLAAGNAAAAIPQLTRALAIRDSLETRMLLAAAQLEQQRGLPPGQQDWNVFRENLTKLQEINTAQPLPDAWRLILLEAGYEAAQAAVAKDADPGRAVNMLRKAELDYPESPTFLRQLAAFYKRLAAESDAERALIKLNFVTAMQAGKWAEAEPWEDKLHAGTKDPLTFWQYYSGRRLVARTLNSKDPALDAATDLLAQLEKDHPGCRSGHMLRALICDRRRDFPAAVEAYRAAVAGGELNERVYERLVLLLAQLGRFDEADAVLADFRKRLPASHVLPALAILVQDRQGDRDGAVLLAKKETETNPADPQARLRLGRLLQQQEKLPEAEKAYQEALVLEPGNLLAASALIELYVQTERKPEGKALLEKLASDKRLTAWQRAQMLATGLELLADRAAAEAVLREAIKSIPASSPPTASADQPAAGKTSPPAPRGDSPAKTPPEDISLHLALAEFLARGQTPASLNEAEQVVRGVLDRTSGSAEAQRTLAGILLLKGGQANRRQALEIMETLAKSSETLGQADALVLARLREGEGDWQAATRALDTMTEAPDATPEQLARYIERLLQPGWTKEVGERLKKVGERLAELERMAPNEPATVLLKARWLKETGRTEEVPAVIEALEKQLLGQAGGDKRRQGQVNQIIGNLFTAVGLHSQAEVRYRRLVEAEPRGYAILARSLARQDRLDEALQLCLDAAKDDATIAPALALHAVLLAGKPTQEQWDKADVLFVRTLETHREDPQFLDALATVRLVQKRTAEAVQLYETLLKIQPKNASAWNNLAVALGEDRRTAPEALAAADRALDAGGQRPAYLDTKATVLLQQGKPQDAVPLLEKAVSGPERDPVHQLHLAVAYARAGRDEDARKAYQTALAAKVTDGILTETDLSQLTELEKKFQ